MLLASKSSAFLAEHDAVARIATFPLLLFQIPDPRRGSLGSFSPSISF